MAFSYNPEEYLEKVPSDIAAISEFLETDVKSITATLENGAASINTDSVKKTVETAIACLKDCSDLMLQMLGTPESASPTDGTIYGMKKLAEQLVEL